MEEAKDVEDTDSLRQTRPNLGFQMLNAGEGQNVGLGVRPDLVRHGLESGHHVIQGDPLLHPVFVTRQ